MAKNILVLVDDLFFSTKISATAQSCGVPVEFVKTKDTLVERARSQPPGLIIVDLNGATTQPLETIRDLKADPELRSAPVLAFLSHVQTELKEQAISAGCDTVIPRSLFSQRLAEILRKHS
jgi:CheY-like chemotaxis protein